MYMILDNKTFYPERLREPTLKARGVDRARARVPSIGGSSKRLPRRAAKAMLHLPRSPGSKSLTSEVCESAEAPLETKTKSSVQQEWPCMLWAFHLLVM